MNKIIAILCQFTLMFCFTTTSHAALITNSISNPSAIVDFSQFNTPWVFGSGPVEVGDMVGESITWSSTVTTSVIGSDYYSLGTNGTWNSGRNGYVGLNSSYSNESMRFDFNGGPVSGVAGFVNYATSSRGNIYGEFIIEALGMNDVILESYSITNLAPISTPNMRDAGEFRGITRNSADIYAFGLTGAVNVLDDLQFTRVPELSSLALLSLGLFGFGIISRKKNR